MKNNKVTIIRNWFLRYALSIFCSGLVIMGMAYIAYSSPGTTTIGENISTTNLTVSGNATTTGNFNVSGLTTLATTTLSGDLDMALKQIKNAVLEKLSAFPSSPVEGQMFWSTATSTPYWYDAANSRWRTQKDAATIVVAASDSQNKEKADYVCDGTNDEVEIQAAINAVELLPHSGKVLLLEGNYNLSNSLVLGSYTTLEGMGMFNTHISSGVMAHYLVTNKNQTDPGNTSITIKNLSLDGTNITAHTIYFLFSQYYTLDSVQITSAGSKYGLYTRMVEADATPVDTVWVRHCRFIGNGINGRIAYLHILDNEFILGSVGIYLIQRSMYGVINDNLFEAQAVQGMYIYQPTDISITNNQFHCGNAGNVQQGIYLLQAQRINIIGNTFGAYAFGLGKEAIYLDGSNNGIVISNNNIYGVGQAANNTYNAIHALNSGSDTNVTVTGNIINAGVGANKMKYGIFIGNLDSNFIVKNNNISGGVSGSITKSGDVATSIIKDNIGYITENSGTTTVASGNTYVDVTHGLSKTPATSTVAVIPTNNLGNSTKSWVSNVGASTFRINTDVDPGATTATFSWQIGSY